MFRGALDNVSSKETPLLGSDGGFCRAKKHLRTNKYLLTDLDFCLSLTVQDQKGTTFDFVRNSRYVAGWSKDFGERLKAAENLSQPLVMLRHSTGQVSALEDRCPHRLLPLSMGKRIRDTIQCGYYGMTFNGSGGNQCCWWIRRTPT